MKSAIIKLLKRLLNFLQKRTYLKKRRKLLENLYLAFCLQSEIPQEFLKKEKYFLKKYKFQDNNINEVFKWIKSMKITSVGMLVKAMPLKLTSTTDVGFLYPLPHFEGIDEENKYLSKTKEEMLYVQSYMDLIKKKFFHWMV